MVHGYVDPGAFPLLRSRPEDLIFSQSSKPLLSKAEVDKGSWQAKAREENLSAHYDKLKALEVYVQDIAESTRTTHITAGHLQQATGRIASCIGACPEVPAAAVDAFVALRSVEYDRFSKNNKLRKRLRKFLRMLNIISTDDILNVIDQASSEGNAVPSCGSTQPAEPVCPAGQGPSDPAPVCAYRLEGDPDVLYCRYPICEVENDFRMVIPPAYAPLKNSSVVGDGGVKWMDVKACVTSVEVVCRGTYMGQPVTKLRLRPLTGRRHQLRMHCLALGHPIG